MIRQVDTPQGPIAVAQPSPETPLRFAVQPYQPQFVPNVATGGNTGMAVQVEQIPMPLFVIAGEYVWQWADRFHLELWNRVQHLEQRTRQAEETTARHRRTNEWLRAGYRFEIRGREGRPSWGDRDDFRYVLVDRHGRVVPTVVPTHEYQFQWHRRDQIEGRTPYVPDGARMLAEPTGGELVRLRLQALGVDAPYAGTAHMGERLAALHEAYEAYSAAHEEPWARDLLDALDLGDHFAPSEVPGRKEDPATATEDDDADDE
jgi:hypothetical protein